MTIDRLTTDNSTYIIAELSANHNNDLDLALRTVEAMAESGADAVKVQTFTADSMTLDLDLEVFRTRADSAWAGQKLYDLYKRGALPYDWHAPIKHKANELGMEFFSTPFDTDGVDFLESLDVPAYKIASLEINHIPLIRYVAQKQKPIMLSTGIATTDDIDRAIRTIREVSDQPISLLKCTTAYPAAIEDSHLANISWFIDQYDVIGGLSDHSMSPFVPALAVAMGARVIEKHFILDRSMGGVDSHFSLQPDEFKLMVQGVRDAEKALGQYEYTLSEPGERARKSRRSVFVKKSIEKGEIFSDAHLTIIRPGIGLSPSLYSQVIGKKATRTLHPGHPLVADDFV